MTCIVGLLDDGKVYMGGDSAGVAGYYLTKRKDKKVFKNGDFLIGFTSSFRMGQLLQCNFTPPKYHKDEDLYKYMVTDFIDAVRTCFKAGGYSKKENEVEKGGTFLVGCYGRLFEIESDFQVGESFDSYEAVGCGIDLARGSMFTSELLKPKERILKALQAAAHFSTGVVEPFTILEI